jgi:hypothetical protein
LCDNDIRVPVDVRRSEAQDLISGVDEQVLALVVLDQTLPMITTVVLDYETRFGVVKVGPGRTITQLRLHVWSGQAGLDQQPAKSSLHWRLGRRGQ